MQCVCSWDAVPLFVDPIYIANLLGMTEETVRRYIRRGQLKAKCVGNGYRVEKSDVREFLDKLPENNPRKKKRSCVNCYAHNTRLCAECVNGCTADYFQPKIKEEKQ